MPTTYTSLRVAGTATIATLIATAVTLTTVTITTGTITTANITTANITTGNVQTLSGATINALQANGAVKAQTVSGAVLKFGGGTALGILCKKADGTIGTVVRSSSGTIAVGACT